MLVFVDLGVSIKVFRVDEDPDGHVGRTRLGIIRKKNMAMDDGLLDLSDSDKAEIEGCIEFYKKAAELKNSVSFYSFPETVREVLDYCVNHATEFETRLISMAFIEGVRTLRKLEKGKAEVDHE